MSTFTGTCIILTGLVLYALWALSPEGPGNKPNKSKDKK